MGHLPGLPHPGSSGDHAGPPPASHERVVRPHAAPPLPAQRHHAAPPLPALTPAVPGPARRRRENSPFSPTSLFYAYLLPDEDPWKTAKDKLRRRTPPA